MRLVHNATPHQSSSLNRIPVSNSAEILLSCYPAMLSEIPCEHQLSADDTFLLDSRPFCRSYRLIHLCMVAPFFLMMVEFMAALLVHIAGIPFISEG